MRKLIISLIVISLVVAGLLYYYVPREIDFNADGIKFRLGNENRGSERSVNVRVKGTMYRSWLGDRTFKGVIDIEGEELPVPEIYRELEVRIGKGNHGIMLYHYGKEGVFDLYEYGYIYFAQDFSKVSLIIYEQDAERLEKGLWNSGSGLMLSAPASSREEALRISNELIKKDYDGFIFK